MLKTVVHLSCTGSDRHTNFFYNSDSWICNQCLVATFPIVPAASFAGLNKKTIVIQMQTFTPHLKEKLMPSCTHVR